MPKFTVFSREVVRNRYSVVTNSIGEAKRVVLNGDATQVDFEVEETLSCWIVDPDGNQTPIDDVEEAFIFPLSAALGGGQIVVSAASLSEALAKIDDEIKALGVPAAPPAPKSVAITDAGKVSDIPVKPVMSDKDLADGLEYASWPYSVKHVKASVLGRKIRLEFTATAKGRYSISVNGSRSPAHHMQAEERSVHMLDGEPGANNILVFFSEDGSHQVSRISEPVIVNLPAAREPSTWTEPAAATPRTFEYLRVKPCLENYDGDVESFNSEEERDEALRAYNLQIPRTFYTIYGVEPGGFEMAIGDFSLKAGAMEVMNAILAPMAKARNQLIDARHSSAKSAFIKDAVNILDKAAEKVGSDLDDFINQSSNGERA